jgi:hypothetical protein
MVAEVGNAQEAEFAKFGRFSNCGPSSWMQRMLGENPERRCFGLNTRRVKKTKLK